MGSRLVSFVVWAAVAATAVFWGLRLMAVPLRAPESAVTVGQDTPAGGDLTRLLGAAPVAAAAVPVAPPPAAMSRFKLVGVVAPRSDAVREGLALISVDGKPPKPLGLGATVDGLTVVLAVRHRAVDLGQHGGPVEMTLDLAALPEANRGALPGAGSPPMPAGMAPAMPAPLQLSPGMPPPNAAPMPVPPAGAQPGGAQGGMPGGVPGGPPGGGGPNI